MKTVKDATKVKRVLQPASTNQKLGNGKKRILKGRWTGMDMYQLVLEERATCPRSCQSWERCYGNNMYLANRIDHRDWKQFKKALEGEIGALAAKHDGGFVVRLHVLGDFFSLRYVKLWAKFLEQYPELHVFGYTHRMDTDKDGIGLAIGALNASCSDRWCVRFSDRGGPMSANVAPSLDGNEIMCPQEQGKTESCLTCALCWSENMTNKSIGFTSH